MDVIILDIPNIEGECTVGGFEKKIELLSFSHGVAMQVTCDVSNKERTSGKPNFQDFTVSKYMDSTTPTLNQNCCEGKVVGQVKISIARNDDKNVIPFIVYTLDDVIISSVSVGGGGSDKPIETITLNCSKVKWEYTAQKSSGGKQGTASAVWDLKTNKAA